MMSAMKSNPLAGCRLRPLSEAREYPVSWLRDNRVMPLLIAGIVSPYGPTLTVIAAVRDSTSAPASLALASLNPFSSEVRVAAYLRNGELSDPLVEQIFEVVRRNGLPGESAPSFCIPASALPPLELRWLCRRLFAKANGLRTLYAGLQRFPLNPWARVNEEFRAAQENEVDHAGGEPASDAAMTEHELDALLDIVLDPAHNEQEIAAFGGAWSRSIELQAGAGNRELAERAFQYDDFMPIFVRLLELAVELAENSAPDGAPPESRPAYRM